jgi:hypothetical protein
MRRIKGADHSIDEISPVKVDGSGSGEVDIILSFRGSAVSPELGQVLGAPRQAAVGRPAIETRGGERGGGIAVIAVERAVSQRISRQGGDRGGDCRPATGAVIAIERSV